MKERLTIYHDTKTFELIEQVNKLLEPYGLTFEDLTEDEDEFLTYQLKRPNLILQA